MGRPRTSAASAVRAARRSRPREQTPARLVRSRRARRSGAPRCSEPMLERRIAPLPRRTRAAPRTDACAARASRVTSRRTWPFAELRRACRGGRRPARSRRPRLRARGGVRRRACSRSPEPAARAGARGEPALAARRARSLARSPPAARRRLRRPRSRTRAVRQAARAASSASSELGGDPRGLEQRLAVGGIAGLALSLAEPDQRLATLGGCRRSPVSSTASVNSFSASAGARLCSACRPALQRVVGSLRLVHRHRCEPPVKRELPEMLDRARSRRAARALGRRAGAGAPGGSRRGPSYNVWLMSA